MAGSACRQRARDKPTCRKAGAGPETGWGGEAALQNHRWVLQRGLPHQPRASSPSATGIALSLVLEGIFLTCLSLAAGMNCFFFKKIVFHFSVSISHSLEPKRPQRVAAGVLAVGRIPDCVPGAAVAQERAWAQRRAGLRRWVGVEK